jgi:uncharacterized protein (DUF2141 family)
MSLTKNLHWFLFPILLCSCARQSAPTGGPRDTIPPVVIKTIPPDEAINFKGNQIQLLFSEDVILNTPKEQLIVTPAIGKEYKITYRKNIVTLNFDKPLEDSTTYTFNFRDAIQDITEKNPVKNLQLALSTGTYIDSLSISGTIYDLLRGRVFEDATVALHTENDTFNIFEDPTMIFTKTDKQGHFKISHLKPDKYFIYAINDKNRNLVVNSRTEAYGYIGAYQQLTDTIGNVNVGLIRLDAGRLKLTCARPYNTYFNIRTTKNLRTFNITASDSSDLSFTFGENNANIRVYKTTDKDSLSIHLVALDSIDNRIDTTLYAKYLTRQATPEKFDVTIQASSLLVERGILKATLTFTKPIATIDFDSIYFQVDSLNKINFTAQDLLWDPLTRKITIEKTFDRALYPTADAGSLQSRPSRSLPKKTPKSDTPPFKPNQLTLGKGAFISIENDSSKHLTQAFTPQREADLSIINIEIHTNEKSYIVELLDNNYKVVQQEKNKPKVRFTDITPGEYQIRLIIDSNSNGRWDPANYFTGEEPEKIVYYRSPDGTTAIKGAKANWEIGTNGEMFITY